MPARPPARPPVLWLLLRLLLPQVRTPLRGLRLEQWLSWLS